MPEKSFDSQPGTPIGISKLASIWWCLNKLFPRPGSSAKGILATVVIISGTVHGFGGVLCTTGHIPFNKFIFWSFEAMARGNGKKIFISYGERVKDNS